MCEAFNQKFGAEHRVSWLAKTIALLGFFNNILRANGQEN
jgi:hypothetical protein